MSEKIISSFSFQEKFTIFYHSLFDFPLKRKEIKKWQFGKKGVFKPGKDPKIEFQDEFYFLKGKKEQVKKRLIREKKSVLKMRIAKKSAKVLGLLPTIKMVGITGSLAMKNADLDSDIDLLIITKNNSLWVSRMLSILLLSLFGFKVRKYRDKNLRDKLCLNMWLDESDLTWQNKDLFSAHEIAQIIPLLNRDKTYERLLSSNKWILDFWPNSVFIDKLSKSYKHSFVDSLLFLFFDLFEIVAYVFQRLYMRKKIGREVVGFRRAVFHPIDLRPLIFRNLENVLVIKD